MSSYPTGKTDEVVVQSKPPVMQMHKRTDAQLRATQKLLFVCDDYSVTVRKTRVISDFPQKNILFAGG